MVNSVTYQDAVFADIPAKFEAGTMPIEAAVGFAEAASILMEIGFDQIQQHEDELVEYALSALKAHPDVQVYHAANGSGIISFTIDGIHPHDVASILADENICIRAGHHCCMPLMGELGVVALCRISFWMYSTKEDIDALMKGILKAKEVFKK